MQKKCINIKNYFEVVFRDLKKNPTTKRNVFIQCHQLTDINLFLYCKASQNSREREGQVNILPLRTTFK